MDQAFDFSKNLAEKNRKLSPVTETLFDLARYKISATTQVFMHLVYEGKVVDDVLHNIYLEFGK